MKKWYPVRLVEEADLSYCEWVYFANQNFSDPFFEESWNKAKSHPFNSSSFRSSTSLEVLNNFTEEVLFTPPLCIIFHCSRCGSTLLSQFLGIQEHHISLAEVPLFDEFLRKTLKKPEVEKEKYLGYLKDIVKCYGQLKSESRFQKLFIKTDSWHFYFWKQYRKLFPKVPFILVYRNQKGMHAVPGIIEPLIFNIPEAEAMVMSQEEYFGRVLEFYFTSILEIKEREPETLLINYNQGGLDMIIEVYKHLALNLSENELLKFKSRMQYHSKNSDLVFYEELELKETPPYLKKSVLLYNRIEQIRNQLPIIRD